MILFTVTISSSFYSLSYSSPSVLFIYIVYSFCYIYWIIELGTIINFIYYHYSWVERSRDRGGGAECYQHTGDERKVEKSTFFTEKVQRKKQIEIVSVPESGFLPESQIYYVDWQKGKSIQSFSEDPSKPVC